VIAALYEDPDLLALSGKTLINAEIAEHYGVRIWTAMSHAHCERPTVVHTLLST
jgi:hypothetical protein